MSWASTRGGIYEKLSLVEKRFERPRQTRGFSKRSPPGFLHFAPHLRSPAGPVAGNGAECGGVQVVTVCLNAKLVSKVLNALAVKIQLSFMKFSLELFSRGKSGLKPLDENTRALYRRLSGSEPEVKSHDRSDLPSMSDWAAELITAKRHADSLSPKLRAKIASLEGRSLTDNAQSLLEIYRKDLELLDSIVDKHAEWENNLREHGGLKGLTALSKLAKDLYRK